MPRVRVAGKRVHKASEGKKGVAVGSKTSKI
jgi:hypothetical protein